MPPDRGCGRRRGDSEAPQTATRRAYRVTAMVELKLFERERERERREEREQGQPGKLLASITRGSWKARSNMRTSLTWSPATEKIRFPKAHQGHSRSFPWTNLSTQFIFIVHLLCAQF